MHTHTLFAAALTCISATTHEQQAINLTSPPDTFRVNTTAQATVTRNGPFLEVALKQHAIRASQKYTATNHVISYSAAVAAQNAHGQWEAKRRSDETEAKLTLEPGETRQIPPKKLLIPINGIKELNKHWVVLQIKLRAPEADDGYGYTYAHSEKINLTP